MTIQVWTTVLRQAQRAWEDQSEALDGPVRNLAQAECDLLGPAVGPAARAFLDTWEEHVNRLRKDASGHADALATTMYDFAVTDAESVQRTQELLQWSDRDTPPVAPIAGSR